MVEEENKTVKETSQEDIKEFERKRRTEQAEIAREEFHEKTRDEKEAEEEQ